MDKSSNNLNTYEDINRKMMEHQLIICKIINLLCYLYRNTGNFICHLNANLICIIMPSE